MGQHHGIACFSAEEPEIRPFYGVEKNRYESVFVTGGTWPIGLRMDGLLGGNYQIDATRDFPAGSMVNYKDHSMTSIASVK